MKPFIVTLVLVVVASIAVSCKPSGHSSSDSTVAADSAMIPALPSGPMDSVTQIAPGGQSGSSATATGKTSGGASSATKTKKTSNNSNAPSNSGIIGRDSVIRFPRRALPTVSSTPLRK